MQNSLNYPKIVETEQSSEEEILLHSLKNCTPYIFSHTILLHQNEILKRGLDLEKLNQELEKFINLRTKLDSEKIRTTPGDDKIILAQLQNQALIINKLVGYNLITNPLTMFSFRQQQNQLSRNISVANFSDEVIPGLTDKITKIAEKEISGSSFKYSDKRLMRLTQKIKKVNDAFHEENGHLSFINALAKELDIHPAG